MAALPALCGVVACGNGAEPSGGVRVEIVGPATVLMRLESVPPYDVVAACDARLAASLTTDSAGVRASWRDGRVRTIRLRDGAVTADSTMTLGQVAAFWGAPDVVSPGARFATAAFRDPEPFRLELTFRFGLEANGQGGTAAYAVDCKPPAPALTGRWVLRTVSGQPAAAVLRPMYDYAYDTLVFSPNVTYSYHVRIEGSGVVESVAQGYVVVSANEYTFGHVAPSVQASGPVRRDGNRLVMNTWTAPHPDVEWVFERIGD